MRILYICVLDPFRSNPRPNGSTPPITRTFSPCSVVRAAQAAACRRHDSEERSYRTALARHRTSSETVSGRGEGRWSRRRNRLPACENIGAWSKAVSRNAASRPLSDRRALSHTRVPIASCILPVALTTALRLPTAPRDRLRVRGRAAPCGRTCHSPFQ